MTTTTVGYGDLAPVSTAGRILAAFLMLTGIGFLGMITGSVSTFFLTRVNTSKPAELKSVADEEIDFIKHKLDHLNELSEDDVRTLNSIILDIWEHKQKYAHMKTTNMKLVK